MLVLKRKSGFWTTAKVSREALLRALNSNTEPELSFRVYNIVADGNGPARVDIAFKDDDRYFDIERPERVAKVSPGLLT